MSKTKFRKTIHGMHRKLFRRGKILSDKEMTQVHNGAEHTEVPCGMDTERALETPDGAVWYCVDDESERGGFQSTHEDGFISVVCAELTDLEDKIITIQSNPYCKGQDDNMHTEEYDIDLWEKFVHFADLNCEPVAEPMTEADKKFVEFTLECTLERIGKIQEEYTSRGQ